MSKADRQRRYRRRKALGLTVFRVALDNWQIDQLERAGLLTEEARNDQGMMADQLADAIEIMLARLQDNESNTKAPANFYKGWGGPESMAPKRYKKPQNVTPNTLWKPNE